MATTYVKAACHCTLNTFQVGFLTSSLPIGNDMCHCNMCRHSTGQLQMNSAAIQGVPYSASSDAADPQPADLQFLKKYQATSRLAMYTCSKCNALIFHHIDRGEGNVKWCVSTGALERVDGIVEVDHHAFIGDTLDGGIADRYQKVRDVDVPRYKTSIMVGDTLPVGWTADEILDTKKQALLESDTLDAYCHCKSIHLTLLPPPTHIPDENDWWLIPPSQSSEFPHIRYHALHCFCNSCRLTSGGTITSWVYLPRSNIIDKRTSKPVVLTAGPNRMQGLSQYESSPGVFRESCARCGANIFYWSFRRKSDVLDLGAGLLDQEQEGARADRWFSWIVDLDFRDDAVDTISVQALR